MSGCPSNTEKFYKKTHCDHNQNTQLQTFNAMQINAEKRQVMSSMRK